MNRHRTLETLVKETLETEPSPAEREAAWQSIIARLSDGEASDAAPNLGLVRRHPRLPHPAVVGVAVGAVVLAALALLPANQTPRGPLPTPHEPRAPLPTGSSAEAAAVLNATASSTRSALPAIGPGEYLFTRVSMTLRGEGAANSVTRSWSAIDGSALIVERFASTRPCPPGRRAARCWRFDTSTTRYRASSDVGELRTEDGREMPVRPEPFSTWRAVVSGEQIVRLPAERDTLLASLRAGAERAAAEHRKRPDPHRKLGGRDMRLLRIKLYGHDLLVVDTVTRMLVDAPLNPDQRAAMLSLLADAPDWYRPGSGAEQLQIRNLGPTKDALGRDGTAVQVGGADLVLDVDAGRLLEIRAYEHGRDAEPVTLTVEAQRVVDSTTGESRRRHA
jgi:hypothetical protein